MNTLDLGLIGNGTISGLLNRSGDFVWACLPRFDGDPAFCSLLQDQAPEDGPGCYTVELIDSVREEQEYLVNTPILITRLYDSSGSGIELTDFAPRFRQHGRMFCPMVFIRRIRRIAGNPRIRIHLRPAHHYGASRHRADARQQPCPFHRRAGRDPPHHRCGRDIDR